MYEKMTDFTSKYQKIYTKRYENESLNAYEVYRHAYENRNHFCLMGRIEDRKEIIGRTEIEVGGSFFLGNADGTNFEVTNTKQGGNVLKLDDDTWTIGINDSWVLGGINSRSTFNVFSQTHFNPTDIDDFVNKIIKGKGEYPLTITGREIFGLRCAGFYEPRYGYGCLLFVPLGGTSVSLSLEQYKNAIDQKTPAEIIQLLKNWLKTAKPL